MNRIGINIRFSQRITVSLLAVTLVMPCAATRACAQQEKADPKLWGAGSRFRPAANSLHQLKEPPDLPQLPAYSGRFKFIHGSVQPANKGWIAYHFNYLTKEDPQQVRDWYHNAFSMYQWKILHAKDQTITANHKDGHICTIVINSSNRQGFKSELGVYYSMAPQQQEPSQN